MGVACSFVYDEMHVTRIVSGVHYGRVYQRAAEYNEVVIQS